MHPRSMLLLLVPLLLLLKAGAAVGQTSELVPGNERGLFVVEDARAQFGELKHHGEALGWRNPEDRGAPDPSVFDHYQGLARYPGTGTPIFYVTQKDDDDGDRIGGYLSIVRLATRPTTGERLMSNLQTLGKDTEDTVPNARDTWIHKIRFDGSLVVEDGTPLAAYEHPGGMAIVDDVLFVPLDTPDRSGACCLPGGCAEVPAPVCNLVPGGVFQGEGTTCDTTCSGAARAASKSQARLTLPPALPTGVIVLFDLGVDREAPPAFRVFELDHQIDNVAVTQRDDGTYLVWTNGDGGKVVRLYKTTTSSLRDPLIQLEQLQAWDPRSGCSNCCLIQPPLCYRWPGGAGAHQSSTFLREPDGSLYLIGMRHPGGLPGAGEDWADLYSAEALSPTNFQLTYVTSHHLFCAYDGGGGPVPMRICNLAAADTAYVSPSGELILYSLPHDDEDGFDDDFVRMGEFRHRYVNRENSPLRLPTADADGPYTVEEGGTVVLAGTAQPSADRPWVELYDDHSFVDRSIVFDFDYHKDLEFWNFNDLDGFNDKTSSIRWRTPVGLDVKIFDNDWFDASAGYRQYVGNGTTRWINDLHDENFNDRTSSMRFLWDITEERVPEEIVVRYEHPDFGGSLDEVARIESAYSLLFLTEEPSPDPTLLIRRYAIPPGTAEDAEELLNGPTPIPAGGPTGLPHELVVRSVEPAFLGDLAWDLDGDGVFGETGAEAALGDELGGSPSFLATELDGPTEVVLTLHAAASGATGVDTAVIEVTNVAPTPTVESIADETGAEIGVDVPVALVGLRLDLTGSFTDPGVADTHTATVDWGDGMIDDLGDVVETVRASHAYAAPGDTTVTLAVVDDDGGVGTATKPVTVVDAAGGLAWVVELLRPLAADRNVRRAIGRLEGEAGGRVANGAIDLLAKGNGKAALVMIRQAMQYVEAAGPGLDLRRIAGLLALSAKSAAVEAVTRAEAAATRANDLRKIQQAWDEIAQGDALLAALEPVGAVKRYETAVKKTGGGRRR